MMFNSFFMPFNSPICDKPPTVYSVLNAIVNGDKDDEDDYTKIKDLAKYGRNKIFDFDYPLTNTMTREYFECMILNHYMTRRIGFDTVTNFKLHLNVKLNAIMPKYNVLFDNYANIINGSTITKQGQENANTNQESSNENKTTNTTDNKYSDTPQGQINDVQDETYLTDYTLTNSDVESNGSSSSSGQNEREYQETIIEKNINENYLKIQERMMSVFDMIFKELDSLFFSIV